MRTIVTLLVFGVLISACATKTPFDTAAVDRSITPRNVLANETANQGKRVLWGGIILDVKNLEDKTRMEILAYPLNRSEKPLQEQAPLGRFLLLHSGFLEPTVYTQGKLVTAQGKVERSQSGIIGESEYVYPVVNAEQLQVWKTGASTGTRSSFHIGIGIGF